MEYWLKETFGSVSQEAINIADKIGVKIGAFGPEEVGGTGTLSAIKDVFTSAYGGEEKSQEYSALDNKIKEISKLKGEDRTKAIQDYITSLPDDDARQKAIYLMRDKGLETKGVKITESTIEAKKTFDEWKDLPDREFYARLANLKKENPDVARNVLKYKKEGFTDEQLDFTEGLVAEKAQKITDKLNSLPEGERDAYYQELKDKNIVYDALDNRIQGLKIYNEWKGITESDFNRRYLKLHRENPKVANYVKEYWQNQDLSKEELDFKKGAIPERAEKIMNKLNSLPVGEKKDYYNKLVDEGVITKALNTELKKRIGNPSTGGYTQDKEIEKLIQSKKIENFGKSFLYGDIPYNKIYEGKIDKKMRELVKRTYPLTDEMTKNFEDKMTLDITGGEDPYVAGEGGAGGRHYNAIHDTGNQSTTAFRGGTEIYKGAEDQSVLMHESLHDWFDQRGMKGTAEEFNQRWEAMKKNNKDLQGIDKNIENNPQLYAGIDKQTLANERFAYLGTSKGEYGLKAFPATLRKYYEKVFKSNLSPHQIKTIDRIYFELEKVSNEVADGKISTEQGNKEIRKLEKRFKSMGYNKWINFSNYLKNG